MSSNIILRHRVLKLLRRYLEDVHDFVEVICLPSNFIFYILFSCEQVIWLSGLDEIVVFLFAFICCVASVVSVDPNILMVSR